MASSRRLARTVAALACSFGLVLPAGAAVAAPPPHAPAHGADAKGNGRDQGSSGPSRTATVATSGEDGAAQSRPGRGGGRATAPGQQKKAQEPSRDPASGPSPGTDESAETRPGRAPEPSPGRAGRPAPAPDTVVEPALVVQPADEASVSPPQTSAPAPQAPAPVAAAPVGDPGPGPAAAEPASPPAAVEADPPGRRVIWPDLDGPFRDLLQDVTTTIQRAVPRDLGPVREPLAEVVPLLLALLGAFLALQRGIGRGMGQVPMVAVAPRHDVVRHGR